MAQIVVIVIFFATFVSLLTFILVLGSTTGRLCHNAIVKGTTSTPLRLIDKLHDLFTCQTFTIRLPHGLHRRKLYILNLTPHATVILK